MDADSDLSVPVEIRSHEQAQLESMVPDVREHFERADLDEKAEAIAAIEESILSWGGEREAPEFVRHLSLTFEEWQDLIKGLQRVEGADSRESASSSPESGSADGDGHGTNRVLHLRRKLFKRVRGRVEGLA